MLNVLLIAVGIWLAGWSYLIIHNLIFTDAKFGRKGGTIMILALGWLWPLLLYVVVRDWIIDKLT